LLTQEAIKELREPLVALFGNRWPDFEGYNPDAEGTILSWAIFPDLLSTSTSRITMAKFFWTGDQKELNAGMWSHPVPLVMRINQTGADPKDWYVSAIYLCTMGPYDRVDAVLAAYKAGSFTGCTIEADPKTETQPGSWDTAGPGPDDKPRTQQTAPGQNMPDGRRWSSRPAEGGVGKQVSWMGWDFFVTAGAAKGPSVWDVRFRGKRVVYELSLQEAAAVYGGGQGDQTYYADNAMTGNHLSPNLRLGVDCPAQSESLTITTWMGMRIRKGGNIDIYADPSRAEGVRAGCIYEMDTGKAIWTHSRVLTQDTAGARGTELVVRTLMNSGNYDYYFQFKFRLDGSIQFESDFAGYMETRWFNPEFNSWESQLSTIVHQGLAAPLHSHLICVKADIDIGEYNQNSLRHLKSVVGKPPKGRQISGVWDSQMPTKYMTAEFVQTEGIDKSTYVHNPRVPELFTVVNRNAPGPVSKWGSPPGYAILPGEAMVNTLPDFHPLSRYIAYAKYTAAFTARRDSEQFATSAYDTYEPQKPFVSLDYFLADNDSLDNADVVAWVTLAHEHVPRSEDLPLIANYPVSFKLLPWNFFDRLAANDLPEVKSGDSECQ